LENKTNSRAWTWWYTPVTIPALRKQKQGWVQGHPGLYSKTFKKKKWSS
jgi:hypothetical protein